jgi:signal transduction histidine kinase/DNA-binding response OmpR family regulator
MIGIVVYTRLALYDTSAIVLNDTQRRLSAIARFATRSVTLDELRRLRASDHDTLFYREISDRLANFVQISNAIAIQYWQKDEWDEINPLVGYTVANYANYAKNYSDQYANAIQRAFMGTQSSLDDNERFMTFTPVYGDSGEIVAVITIETDNNPTLRLRSLVNSLTFLLLLTMAAVAASGYIYFLSRKRQLEKNSEMDSIIRLVFNATPLACSFRDVEGNFSDCNDEAVRMFGCASKEELINDFYLWNPPVQPDGSDSKKQVLKELDNALKTGYLKFNWMYKTKDGEPLPAETTFVRVKWRDSYRIAGYTRDLRPEIANEQKMRETNEHARQMEIEAHAAQVASKTKSAFLATMSHEIRTPLNAIIGLSVVERQNLLPTGTRDTLEKIYTSGSTLLNIVNDILDVSKIETGNLVIAPSKYSLVDVVSQAVQLNIVRIGSKEITFDLQMDENCPSVLYGDELRVKQILNNLLSNAFKYTPKGLITFKISHEKSPGSALLVFDIIDTGTGIKEQDIGKLFKEYSQLDATANRKIEGTGLGLSITKKLLDMMGGSIEVESHYGVGSRFTVKLPQEIVNGEIVGSDTVRMLKSLEFIASVHAKSKNFVRSHMPYGKVLVVDDVPTNLDVAKGLMMPYGLLIDTATSGYEAITNIREQKTKYDIIFMDHMMPEMDGIKATQIIRGDIGTEYAKTVPIIALTANAILGNEDMFLSNGFNGYISKPIDIVKLDSELNKWVRDKQNKETLLKAKQDIINTMSARPRLADKSAGLLSNKKVNGINLPMGVSRYGEEAYLSIIRSYVTHTPSLVDRLRAPTEAALAEYTIAVHGLKGSSYGICANEIGKQAETLEKSAKSGNFQQISESNADLIALVGKTLADLKVLLAETEKECGGGKKPRAKKPDGQLLITLREASRRFRPLAMEDALAKLEKYEYETGGELVAWLREKSDALEYDKIYERLKDIAG